MVLTSNDGLGGAFTYDSLTFGAANPTNPSKTSGNPVAQPGGCACGDPINLGNGSVFEQVTDYSTVGSNQRSDIPPTSHDTHRASASHDLAIAASSTMPSLPNAPRARLEAPPEPEIVASPNNSS